MYILTKVKLLLRIAKRSARRMRNNKKFSDRIKYRHEIFWKAPNAEKIRNTIMDAGDPMEKWEDVKYWQRKLSNKYNSREFAKKHNCRVPELYWKGRDCNSIDFNSFPAQYVIRPTIGHSLQLIFLMNNSINLMDGRKYSEEDIKEAMAGALQKNENLVFLIEEFVKTETGEHKIPDDYKFYMFNGRIGCIQVINRLNNCKGYTTWYDENWIALSNLTTNYPDGNEQPAPKCLDEMMECARRLSKAYKIFIRIDFYATDKGVVFGEFTPTPAVGKGFTPGGDALLTDYWDRYCSGMV